MILLDTCVVSEAIRPNPEPAVLAWLETLDEKQVYLPSLVLGELRKGVELLGPGKKKEALSLWLEQLDQRFDRRIVNFDSVAAHRWGVLTSQAETSGTPLPVVDGQLAALASVTGAVFATRNTADFEATGIALFNPWMYSL